MNTDAASNRTTRTGRRRGLHRLARDCRPWRTRLAIVAAAVVALLGGTGLALAYWGGSGTGTGSATAGRTSAVTLTPGTPDAALHPGGESDVTLSVSSPNAAAVTIRSLALDTTRGVGGFDVDADHSACSTSPLSFATQTNGGAGWTVPPRTGGGDGVLAIQLPRALAMSAAAGNPCQGALFVVYLTAVS